MDNSRVIPEGSPCLSREPNCIDLTGSAERREEGMSLSVSPGPWELRTGAGWLPLLCSWVHPLIRLLTPSVRLQSLHWPLSGRLHQGEALSSGSPELVNR